MTWKRGKEEAGQVAEAGGQVAEEAAVVVVHQARALALDHHRGAPVQEQEVEVAAEVEVVDAQCTPETSVPTSSSVYLFLTKMFLHTEALHTAVANTTVVAQQQHTNPEADHQVESFPLPLAAAFSALH